MEFEGSDEVCVLDCNHCYHTDCIAQWFKHSKVMHCLYSYAHHYCDYA